jgi:hypothetical protein
MHVCVTVYIWAHVGERKPGARKYERENLGARKTRSANAKARNLRPKKERESASVKGFRQERESASAKTQKKRVSSSGYYIFGTERNSMPPPTATSSNNAFAIGTPEIWFGFMLESACYQYRHFEYLNK